MEPKNKALLILIMLCLSMHLPIICFSQKVLNVRHTLTIYSDDRDRGLKEPEGIARGSDLSLLVADTGNGRLLRYNYDQGSVKPNVEEIIAPQAPYPVSVGVNSKQEIYILDGRQRRIVHLESDGSFKNYLEPQLKSSPRAYVPKNFFIDYNDNIYVLDILSRNVLVVDSQDKIIKQIPLPEESEILSDLTVDINGDILVIDGTKAIVYRAAKESLDFIPLTKSLKENIRFPTRITTDSRGRIYLVDRNGGAIILLGQDGSYLGTLSGMGWKDGFLNYPSQMCVNDEGEIFIADTRNNRVQVFKILE